jgi:hypothetical protein
MVAREAILVLAQQSADPVLEQLDPPRRAAVIMALLGLVLTGLLLVTIAMLGAHWVRRLARHKPDAWRSSTDAITSRANHRGHEVLQSILPDVKTEDTIHIESSTRETTVDP